MSITFSELRWAELRGTQQTLRLQNNTYTAGERESHDMYDLGDFNLVSGETLPKARIAYKAWGTLNADKSNAIVYPTWFTGEHATCPSIPFWVTNIPLSLLALRTDEQ